MNMRSIAKLAGVSLSTVSKAFSGSQEISEATRQKIFEIAKEHGLYDIYNKNKFEKKVIAVIYPEALNDFYSEAITILNEEITAKGGIMLSSMTQFKANKTKELINYYTAYCHVDGIICVCPAVDLTNPSLIPGVVIFGGSHKYDGWTNVRTDLRSSMVDAVIELKRLGHTNIGLACETTTKGKLEDFKHAMRSASLPLRAEWIAKSGNRFEKGGAEIARSWISSGRIPSAVICSNDYKAIGINIVTIFLGISVGATANAENFLKLETIFIIFLGLAAFCVSTCGGLITGKIMCKLTGGKINPLIGSAGVSAVPMAARVSNDEGRKYDPSNFLLMHAMGPNVAGVIGSAVAAGVFLSFFR